ncbi:long-chain fatty acid transport protein 1-like isoform X2 [Physella acuta]|uniref:long-chain fatty acid transport protein 1-like isoform X1 n=1 Tax=Physella acuta TaxID=109671 RepID=UPI0027DEA0DC|nr:long-chain fatty acid transport protein 1-like isoform X1 [Physella acuta]XP_059170138.1 long-chain fatty acid transport protein 1-like isoform X2 [Physella acuta]XP_059170139.1 long-chain fatty acid transport protein 1-like isoform X2 [Physella acuta]XP_059170140.1 long-chain fatty acid transport protein 1-like isoform X2 [Physella acuta]XP_059170141.1 long-chain fatty acid transport protein 1-like isoform X2 [Physella acuta]XP_059170142.1 long-chain fatty acid transport protein 1-like iso
MSALVIKCTGFLVLGTFFLFVLNLTLLWSLVALFAIYLATGGWRFMRVFALTATRDLNALRCLITVKLRVRRNLKNNMTVVKIFEGTVRKNPNKAFVHFQDQVWTFNDAKLYADKIANFFYDSGYRKGDVIALFTENCPQYIPLWLGMSKMGIVAALINFNLRDMSLAHCIKISEAKAVIFGENLVEAVKDIRLSLPQSTVYFCLGNVSQADFSAVNLDNAIETIPLYEIPTVNVKCSDRLFYVYTSGTTGLPKAAVVTNTRFCYMGYGVELMLDISPKDVIYISLPLYHTAGGIIGAAQAILSGTTLALRTKFSASQFWTDCVKYQCTVAQYIGELCRYLLAQPVRPEETQHSVRLMFGNGIKPQIWKQFQDRFGIKMIGEFYGATEGNCSIVNNRNKIGAVGFTTRILPFLYPITLIKVDLETNEVCRDKNGVCIKAEPGEPGELVGKIVKGDPVREFDGYVDDKATTKKVIRDVFSKGDLAFSTGDILVMDELGFFYFRDRTGDTFRWRGENVSTSEVEAVISNVVGLKDAVVYGVEVPGYEGRAGMAAIVDETGSINTHQLGLSLSRALPAYARPLFIRLLKEADTTGTFKLKKTNLRDEGFNVTTIKDRIFILDQRTQQYQVLTPDVYKSVLDGRLRV